MPRVTLLNMPEIFSLAGTVMIASALYLPCTSSQFAANDNVRVAAGGCTEETKNTAPKVYCTADEKKCDTKKTTYKLTSGVNGTNGFFVWISGDFGAFTMEFELPDGCASTSNYQPYCDIKNGTQFTTSNTDGTKVYLLESVCEQVVRVGPCKAKPNNNYKVHIPMDKQQAAKDAGIDVDGNGDVILSTPVNECLITTVATDLTDLNCNGLSGNTTYLNPNAICGPP